MKGWLTSRRSLVVTGLLLLPGFLSFFGLFFYPTKLYSRCAKSSVVVTKISFQRSIHQPALGI